MAAYAQYNLQEVIAALSKRCNVIYQIDVHLHLLNGNEKVCLVIMVYTVFISNQF